MFLLLIKAKNIVLDILFPPLCLNCQKHLQDKNKFVCDDCLAAIKFNNTLFCPVCRARLADNKRICHYDSQYLLAAAGNYDDLILQNLIHYFKYKSFKNLAPVLAEILIKYLELITHYSKLKTYIVIPIPLHPRRERQRGFNQAKLIAGIVAKKFNWDLFEGLKRIKNDKPQVGLRDSEARIKNIANCFGMESLERVRNKNILLVDDVFTSGATMNEAVKVLKVNGARRIIALVLAKA